MPAPNLVTLAANPDALLTWLGSNLLTAGNLANVINPPGFAYATFTQDNVPVAVNSSGVPIDVYKVKSDGAGPGNGVPAHICNYTAGTNHSVLLTNMAQFCFTITLNGCTFGIGTPDAQGRVVVTHANSGGNTINQRNQIQGAHGVGADMAGVTLLEPAVYRRINPTKNMQATVFGIRSGGGWRFYFQSYEVAGQNMALPNSTAGLSYMMHGVFPI